MLLQLTPDKIARFWDIIEYAVQMTLPPTVGEGDKSNEILSSALSGKVQVWISFQQKETKVKVEGVILTQIQKDDVSNTRSLLLYTVYGYTGFDQKSWIEMADKLVKYAKSRNCVQIIGYTAVSRVIELAKQFGADLCTFVKFDVSNTEQLLKNLGSEA